jgi:protein SCO1/2
MAASALLISCGRVDNETEAAPGTKIFQVKGLIRDLAPDRKTATIEHEDIPGLMPSMIMPFDVKEPAQLGGLKAGDAIAFRFVVGEDESWIDEVKKIAPESVQLPRMKPAPVSAAAKRPARVKEGDPLPAFELTSQDGQSFGSASFRGQPLVLTFIFTRCPVPNFCPLMSKNFQELQAGIRNLPQPLDQTHLLSITIDPKFDTPAVLKDYAAGYGADPRTWTFATGGKETIDELVARFAVQRELEGGTIGHGLATALIGPDGTVAKIWRGNGWSAKEVVEEIEAGR